MREGLDRLFLSLVTIAHSFAVASEVIRTRIAQLAEEGKSGDPARVTLDSGNQSVFTENIAKKSSILKDMSWKKGHLVGFRGINFPYEKMIDFN
jgi:hypothetical protein